LYPAVPEIDRAACTECRTGQRSALGRIGGSLLASKPGSFLASAEAEHNEKGENEAGNWHAQRALEYSDHAYKLAMEAHSKSGRIVSI
jgi:hypothetical protein